MVFWTLKSHTSAGKWALMGVSGGAGDFITLARNGRGVGDGVEGFGKLAGNGRGVGGFGKLVRNGRGSSV